MLTQPQSSPKQTVSEWKQGSKKIAASTCLEFCYHVYWCVTSLHLTSCHPMYGGLKLPKITDKNTNTYK